MQCIIMDIDGTLSNAEHRLHLLPNSTGDEGEPLSNDWTPFLDAAVDDALNVEIRMLSNAIYQTGRPVVICTGRNERYREATEAWLKKHTVHYDHLLMRREGDHRPDQVVKKEMLDHIRALGMEPVFAVEDRARVVKMWRDNGIRCLQVCEGNY